MKLKRFASAWLPVLFACSLFPATVFASAPGLRPNDRVYLPPSYTFTYTTPVCRNSTGNLPITISGSSLGVTFSSFPGSLPINGLTGELFPNGSTTPGNYTITSSAGSSAVVFIPPSGNANISPANVSICQGGNVTLFATLSGSGLSAFGYTWAPGQNANNIVVSPNVSTSYTVTITDNYGCTHSAARNVNVTALPSNLATSSSSYCSGAGLSTTVGVINGTAPGQNYVWQPGGSSGQVINVSPSVTTIYTVTVYQSGCSKTLTAKVSVSPAVTPTVDFNYPFPICTDSGDPLPIKATGFTGGGTFFSDVPDFPLDPVTGKIKLSGLESGNYVVSYSLAQQGCQLAGTGTSELSLTPASQIAVGPSQTIVEGEGIMLSASGEGGFLWEPDQGLNCTECPSPYAAPQVTTRYCVSDPGNGCNHGGCLTVEVVCKNQGDFSVPTAFTPNGDKRNDKFCLQGWTYCVTGFEIHIYNRWGQEVYTSNKADFCWDGIWNGEPLPAGVYVYAIKANVNREAYQKSGNITIIR